MMEATPFDHDLLSVEFDALAIEVRVPKKKKKRQQPMDLPKKYPAKLHARKVAEILGAQDGLIYLPGQMEAQWEDSDQGPPFRQRRYFYYLTGFDFPGFAAATYDIGADKLTVWIPRPAPPATVLWLGSASTPSPDAVLARSDVHDVQFADRLLAKYLAARLPRVRGPLYVLRAQQLPDGLDLDRLRPRLQVDVESLQPAMDEARLVKDDFEVAMIRRANRVSSQAHAAVARALREGRCANECQIEAAFVNSCLAQNAHAQSYPVIAGSGANASTLHYEANNQPLAGRELVVLDAGAEWACYASDVTRTLPLRRRGDGGAWSFSPPARAVYDLVLRMQTECIAGIRPGVVFRDLQLRAARVAVEGLLALGIFRREFSADEIYAAGTAAAFFPHGLGHHVGLDVHDVLSRELLRPAGEGMWGKRRPVGPQTLRGMIRQQQQAVAAAAAEAAATDIAAATSADVNNSNNNNTNEAQGLPHHSQQATTPATANKKKRSSTISSSSSLSSASSSKYTVLQPNMVVTIEPGIYFCRPYIEWHFLRDGSEHRRYFDLDVLERYWDVGGVRIEDCVLVTADGSGHENLTEAPKWGVDDDIGRGGGESDGDGDETDEEDEYC